MYTTVLARPGVNVKFAKHATIRPKSNEKSCTCTWFGAEFVHRRLLSLTGHDQQTHCTLRDELFQNRWIETKWGLPSSRGVS